MTDPVPDLVVVYRDASAPADDDVRLMVGSTPGADRTRLKLRCLQLDPAGQWTGVVVFCNEAHDLRYAQPPGTSLDWWVSPNPIYQPPTLN